MKSSFKAYLTGKSVALVGPASTLHGSEMGKMIDGHDVVVRINHAWPLPEELKGDIGSRTDVIYHNLNPSNQRIRRRDVVGMYRDGVRWMISSHPGRKPERRRRQLRFRKVNRGLLGFRAIPSSIKRHLRPRVGGSNSGLVAIVDLLRFPIKRLYVTGFSFYTTGYLKYPNYKKHLHAKALRHHDQSRHKTYMARLVAREKRLEVDLFIARILDRHINRRRRRR